ncbi:tetratricopeptide repeat protein [Actinosynnema sp. NPDC004786]
MTACAQCGGTVDDTGFCVDCGEPAAVRRGTPARTAARASGRASGRTASSAATTGRRTHTGDPMSLPVFDFKDPTSRIITDPRVPVRTRLCPNEQCPDRSALPQRDSGFCLACGTPFSFLPSLEPGALVADQYRVVGCFARGGLGWIYLARDTHLDDNPVVLKGLIDVADLDISTKERQALTLLDHPNIVRIYNFVSHPDAHTGEDRAYIVMEYVDGLVLEEVADLSARGRVPLGEPLRTEHVIAAGLQLLAAFDYLHERGFLYCDLKPDNVIIRSGKYGERANRVKLIDLGAVRRIGDRTSKIVGTRPYQVDEREIAERGLTVQSDLHTLGVMLRRLDYATADHDEPERTDLAVGLNSFQRAYDRAKHLDPDQRYGSAAEMADQLRGVLREVASLRDGVARPEPSTVFVHTTTLLDAGLGAVPALATWTDRAVDRLAEAELPDGRPAAAVVAVGLPVPRATAGDPAADVLAAADTEDPRRLIARLDSANLTSPETALVRCRAALAAQDVAAARESLTQARGLLGRDWRVRWHEGLIALADGEVDAARQAFDDVYSWLPGEDAPKLALAYCAEHERDLDRAEALYEAVWRRDRSVVSAVFGLARVRLARGDRAGAVALLDETPQASRYFDAAHIAAVRVLSGHIRAGDRVVRPTDEDLAAATARLRELYLDGGAPSGESRVRLETVVREAALAVALAAGADATPLRLRVEESYRALARQAATRADRSLLVDRANHHRPITSR